VLVSAAHSKGRAVQRKPAELIGPEQYMQLLQALLDAARGLDPAPQCVVGMKRSGLFPAVFLSHQLELPMLVQSELKGLKRGKFDCVLLVDTTAWKGNSLRKAALKLERAGCARIHTLVMYARRDPPPSAPGLHFLCQADSIPRFWYE